MRTVYKITKYEDIEVSKDEIKAYVPGFTYFYPDSNPKTIATFDNESDAYDAFEKYTNSGTITDMKTNIGTTVYIVTEYFFEEVTLDDDDDETGWDYIDCSKPKYIYAAVPDLETTDWTNNSYIFDIAKAMVPENGYLRKISTETNETVMTYTWEEL